MTKDQLIAWYEKRLDILRSELAALRKTRPDNWIHWGIGRLEGEIERLEWHQAHTETGQ